MDLGPQAAGAEPRVHQSLNDPGQLREPVLKHDSIVPRTNDGEKALDRLEFTLVHHPPLYHTRGHPLRLKE